MNKKDERKGYLDVAKGIGIVLVVWAHADGPFGDYINSFHMPFFFFISGMLFVPEKKTCKEYVMGKCKSLLFPFLGWNLLLYPLFYILYYWKEWSLKILFIDVLEIVFTLDKVPFLGATWFLASLFWISIVIKTLWNITRKVKYQDITILIFGIISSIVGFMVTLPYRQSRTLICCFFYICGYLYMKYVHDKLKSWRHILTLLSGILYCYIVTRNECSFPDNIFESKSLFVFGAFLGIYFTLSISVYIAYFAKGLFYKLSVYLGQNTLPIVIWHFLAFRIAIILQVILDDASIKELVAFPIYNSDRGWWIAYVVCGIGGSLVWNFIMKHNYLYEYVQKKKALTK